MRIAWALLLPFALSGCVAVEPDFNVKARNDSGAPQEVWLSVTRVSDGRPYFEGTTDLPQGVRQIARIGQDTGTFRFVGRLGEGPEIQREAERPRGSALTTMFFEIRGDGAEWTTRAR